MTSASPSHPRLIFVNRYFAPDQSATSQMLTDLAFGLVRSGWQVHVVCAAHLYDDPHARLVGFEEIDGVSVHRVATSRFGRDRLLGRSIDYLSFYMTCTIKLLALLQRGDILVAKTDPPLVSLVCAGAAFCRRTLLVTWQQDVFPEIASLLAARRWPWWLARLLRSCRDASLRAAAMNVVIGRKMLEYFVATGISASRLCLIENWADASRVAPKKASSSLLRAQLGLLDSFVAVYSGNLGRAHEFETILGAAKTLQTDPKYAFLIIGGGAKISPFKQAVAKAGLNNVHFLPYQPRDALEDSMAAADVHLASLLPALEGLVVPSKFYGILAAARPIVFIGDPEGELSLIIREAQCGCVVRIADSTELAQQLCRLRAEPQTCEAMGVRARRLLNDKYDVLHGIEKWSALLSRLPRNGHAASSSSYFSVETK